MVFCLDILCIRRAMGEIDLPDLIPGSEQVEEDRLIRSLLTEFEVIPVYRRFGTVLHRNIVPGTTGSQNVQDTVEQAAGVTPGSANVRLCWRKVVLDNCPEIIVNFPENHDPEFYLKGLIISHENHIGIENGAQVVVLPNAASRRLLRPGDFHRLRLWPNVAS